MFCHFHSLTIKYGSRMIVKKDKNNIEFIITIYTLNSKNLIILMVTLTTAQIYSPIPQEQMELIHSNEKR